MPKKPTGKIGPLVMRNTPAGTSGGWETIKFPGPKDEVERFMLDLWISEMRKAGRSVLSVTKNPEDHFDFTLELPGGTVYMDLAELFYCNKDGIPYENDDIEIRIYDFAAQTRDTVLKKSQHYGKAGDTPIHLLLYITHWRFWPAEPVIRLAQHFLSEAPPITENVFLVLPFDAANGTVRVLYPSRDPLEGRSPDEFVDKIYWTLDPSKGQFISKVPGNDITNGEASD